jgi:hypothetical protein
MGSFLNLLFIWAKLHFLVQNRRFAVLKSYGRSYGEFSFPHNFAKNDRQDLKMGYGCIDASRRQLRTICAQNWGLN